MIALADQLVIAAEDEVGQAGGAAVLFTCLINPMKELSGELGPQIASTPAAAQVVLEEGRGVEGGGGRGKGGGGGLSCYRYEPQTKKPQTT